MKKFILKWLFGFILLFALDAFMEVYVFEWLKWNGTSKNDWFFILWWIVVVGWASYGIRRLLKK